MTTATHDAVGSALAGRYRVEREIGAGGMATVYLARDLKHDRDVAIKVLHANLSSALGAERFLTEIRTTARLQHPHILPLFDSGDADGMLFYVMPLVRGDTLRDWLDRERQLPVDTAVRVTSEIAGALDYAHREGIIHRDIKPENILLQDGHALVADFGIGKVLSTAEGSTLTQVGVGIGTPAYMSPEQAVGEAVDGRSDLYSLGCVLYELLVGEPPFTGPNPQSIIAKRFVQTPADVTALREGVPRPVARALQRALARTPIDRPSTAADLVALLQEPDAPASVAVAAPAQSIAVLPFVNLSPDRDNEYFGDGIAEDIINALASIDGLHVAARISAFSFKGKDADLRTIGEQLNVATVLQGSVRKAGNRIRITAQLMAVSDGYQLWSERYDRDLIDVFAVQDEIASAIASRLQLTFAKPTAATAPATTADVEAYELIVRGRALTARRGRAILEGVACFERAIELTPMSSAAHAGLGNALRAKSQYGLALPEECVPRAHAAFERALELDPENAEAMGNLATLLGNSRLDIPRMFSLWERALDLDPRLSEVRVLYAAWGLVILQQGRGDEHAAREFRRAIADDPRNPINATVIAMGLSALGRTNEAIALAKRACDMDPTAFAPRYALSWVQTWGRDTEGGFATVEIGMDQFGRHPWFLQTLTGLYMQRGDTRRAEAIHAEIEARAITSRISYFTRAISAIYLGRIDEAMEHAMRSAELMDGLGPIWYRWPDIEPLQRHPRYPELIAKMEA